MNPTGIVGKPERISEGAGLPYLMAMLIPVKPLIPAMGPRMARIAQPPTQLLAMPVIFGYLPTRAQIHFAPTLRRALASSALGLW